MHTYDVKQSLSDAHAVEHINKALSPQHDPHDGWEESNVHHDWHEPLPEEASAAVLKQTLEACTCEI
jgi:hypothetical protein